MKQARRISLGRLRRRLGSILMALCLMLTLLPVIAPPARAAYDLEVYVDAAGGSGGDGSQGSPYQTIGAAITYAEGQSAADPAIYIAAGTYTENLTITQSMSLIGAAADTTIIDGASSGRVINITDSSASVTLENLTIQNGKAPDGATAVAGGNGGGILCAGSLTITDCVIKSNRAGSGGNGNLTGQYSYDGPGGGGAGGGIYCSGALTLTGCTISDNNAGVGGQGVSSSMGGLIGATGGYGGGICSAGLLTVTDCTITGNKAGTGGEGGYSGSGGGTGGTGGGGGGIRCLGTTVISDSTIISNTAGTGGQGNDGGDGGTGGNGGGVSCKVEINMTGTRIVSNTAGSGGSGDDSGSDGSGGKRDLLNAQSGSADNNWWGSNSGPTSDDTNMTVSKWLVLSIATKSMIAINGTAGVTASLDKNNLDETVQSDISGDINFDATSGAVRPRTVAIVDASAAAVYTAPASAGTATITAALDNESVTATVSVEQIAILEDSISLTANKYQQFTLTPVNASGTLTWSAVNLPDGLSIDAATGVISGTPTVSGDSTANVTLLDTRTDVTLTVTKSIDFYVYTASGNGAYLVEPVSDAAYTAGVADGLIPTMTVNNGVTGFTYFAADISAVQGHGGEETAVFVHLRGGAQIGMSFVEADFENVSHIGAGFNVQAGDVIKVYIVDGLENGMSGNPNIL